MKLFNAFAFFLAFSFHAAAQTAGFTPLIKAAAQKTVDEYAIGTLIQNGANVNSRDEQGRSVLMLAAMHNPRPAVIFALIKSGAEVNARTPDTGQTALFFAVRYNPNPDVIITLLNNGADQDIEDIFHKTAYDYIDRNPKIKGSEAEFLFKDYDPGEESSDDEASR
ncbi:MAG: ankyrin repeat domain-containing protein [Alphaproteobacteria bacterium]|nr:ankyrin repeat domain-containing protein [Alphaproteobacteria bacterium]